MQRSLLLIALACMLAIAVAYPMSEVITDSSVAKRDSEDGAVAEYWPITYYGHCDVDAENTPEDETLGV
ncbi:hypothetical protein BDR03DRAFT_975667 [Suillus americanus]|nr:hypothetical protein BDR03DRAFT_975640 [Suillus americanus]KAG2029634.1 hypothetical protein BDR03DRAFT_975667 [Suillus americanus]